MAYNFNIPATHCVKRSLIGIHATGCVKRIVGGNFKRQSPIKMEKQFDTKKLIEFAVKAPSGHNTQPWRFIVRDREIQIHPDLTRILPVVDSDNHALYIGLGCAAENIVIAAKKYGVKSLVSISTSIKNDDCRFWTMLTQHSVLC